MLLVLLVAGPVTATATADRTELRLSESATLTLTVEGDAPLRVTPPAAWLPGADPMWRLRPLGPARVEDVTPSRQRWTLTLRADPDVPGETPLQLATAQVTAGTDAEPREVAFPPLTLRVVATVVLGRDQPRPPTDVEEPQPEPPTPATPAYWAAAVVALTLLAALTWGRRRSARTAVPESPRGHFERELANLRTETVPREEFPARLSAAVRRYVEAVDGLPALRRTPREIAPLAAQAARLHDLPELLRRCDEARFSHAPLDAEVRAELLASAARLAGGSP